MNEEFPGYKLLLNYEVNPEKFHEYRQFMTTTYVPSMGTMGFQLREAWRTAYGAGPDHLVEFVCKQRGTLEDIVENDEWIGMNEQLQKYVTEFSYKGVPYRNITQF